MWQKKSDAIKRNWHAAKKYCEDLMHGGYSDWKLPEKKVVKGLVEKKDLFVLSRNEQLFWSLQQEFMAFLEHGI